MQRDPSASSSSSPESIFTGVRFVLFGFDSVSEAQYRSELVCRGGTDVGRYDSSCSHVIVCGRVYDDPVCDAARQDGKALVSELWIDDSLDFGALADTTRVLYRPVKDLNGIPGCESLCICLTGYQRQERDDIMKMVSLMGARFSKPLIANQVTHLVCYKFEGEKYELAKKVNIKLVNHRWLEDCLKAWELVPTANYSKSGWELEILDAEARDSEEEAVDPGKSTLRNKTVLLPSSTLGGVTQKFEAQQVTIPAQQSDNPDVCLRDNSIFSTPHKKATSGNASDKYLNTKTLEANYHKDTMGITPVDGDIIMRDAVNDGNASKFDANSNMDGNLLPSSLRTVKQYSPFSATADGKSGNQSYLMKTPSKLVSAADLSTTLPHPKRSLEVSKSKIVETRENIVSTNIPSPASGASAHNLEEHGSILPQRMKGAVSVGEQSPKLVLQDLNASVSHSPTRARYEQMEALTVLPRSSNVNGLACIDYCPDGAAVMSSNATLEAATSKLKGVSYKKRYDKQGQPALGIKTSSATVSHFDWNMTDMLVDGPSHTLNVSMSIQDNSSALEPKTRNDDSPNRVLPVDNQQATVKLPTTKSSARNLGRTAVVRTVGETSAKEIALESSPGASERYEPCMKSEPNSNIPVSDNPNDPTGGDIAMSDIANASTEEPGEAFTLQQQEGVLSLDIGNSESKKLSSTASDVASIENDVKEVTVTHTKKVPQKNLGTKKRTVNTRKDKVVESSDRITTSIRAAAEPDVAGKVKAGRSCADIANIATEEPGGTFTLHQKEGDLSADSQNLETRKISSEASDVASKENDVKEATVANAKKVAPKKNFGTKKRSTVNMGKDKVVASSDRTTTSNLAATEQGIVGNVKADTPVGDIANIITEEPGETCTQQQQEGVLSLDSQNSETRKLLSADSDVACKENDAKEATVAHTKRVVPKKNLGTKKHSTVNMRKDKVVASADGTTTLNQVAAEVGIVGKMKTDTPGGDNANITIEEPGETFLLQQKEGVLSPNTRNSKKLSSAASVVACKENVTKEETVTRTKKVVSKKNVGTKSTVNTRKNKAVASSDTTTTSNQDATEPGIVGEAKADTLGDNVNTTTEEIGKTSTLQQKVEVLSPDTRSSRRLSSAASVDACKENDIKAAAVAQTKKITKRNMGSKKLGAGKCRKDEVTSLDEKATSTQDGADPGMVGKSKAEHKHASEISGLKKGIVNPVSVDDEVDAIMQNNVKVEPQSASRKRSRNTARDDKVDDIVQNNVKVEPQSASRKGNRNTARDWMDTPMDPEKENKPRENGCSNVSAIYRPKQMVVAKHGRKRIQDSKGTADENKKETQTDSRTRLEPARFMLSGHRLQRKELQAMVKSLKGRLCWDTHNWSYQATHLIIPDPLRRTEKFFAAAAAGRWILKTDYLTASFEAGRFLEEESFEWYKKGLTEDGAISLEAPRRWRLLRERTGHGALYGMRIIIYGDCIAPSLDTLKRVVKAGDGTILATAPPYDRFLKVGADYAIISPGMPHVDAWVQEFLRHEIPCIAADYLVEYVCKPGYSLERHVLFKTHAWADKSFANSLRRSDEVVASAATPLVDTSEDIRCAVCGSSEMGEVMLLCGDEGGTAGCGIATHISCCVPPLEAVPDGDWFCPKCSTHISCCVPPLEAVPDGDWFCPKCSSSKTSKAPFKSKRMKSSAKRK